MGSRSKVLIVDDQTLYREGLRGIIANWPEFEVVGMACCGEDAISFCQREAPDLVLMDVSMPGGGCHLPGVSPDGRRDAHGFGR